MERSWEWCGEQWSRSGRYSRLSRLDATDDDNVVGTSNGVRGNHTFMTRQF